MSRSSLFKLVGVLVALSMLLVSCGAAAPATTAPATSAPATSAPAATTAPPTSAPATSTPAATTAPAGNLPTLNWYFVTANQYNDQEMAAVEDAANALIAKSVGAKIAFHTATPADAPNKISLLIQSGESCDLISFGTFTPIQPAITAGGIIPLETLLPQYAPTVWSNFSQQAWNSTKQADGHIYGALDFQIGGVSGAAMWVRKDLVDKYHFDWQKATKPEDWEPFFDEILKNEKGITPLISSDPFWGRAWWPNQHGYDPISTAIGAKGDFGGSIGVKMDDPTRTVVSVADTPEYREAVTLNRSWYLKGYYLKTPPADAEMGSIRGNLGFAAFYVPFGGFSSTSAMSKNEWAGVPIITAFVQSPLVKTLVSSGSSYGVCKTSKHPDLAVKFIEAMNTNADLLNLLNYGIQGKDWVWQDQTNKVITLPSGVTGTNVGWNPNTYWQFGDQRLMYLTSHDDIGLADKVAAAKKTATLSNMAGFVLDTSQIESEIANISSAATQYCDPVDKGLVDVDTGIKACQNGLKAAGMDQLLAEVQKQINAWAASQK